MKHIVITNQNSNVEVVDSNIIHKLAEEAQDCDASSNMTGYLRSQYVYRDLVEAIMERFADVVIEVPESGYLVRFANQEFQAACEDYRHGVITESWANNADEITFNNILSGIVGDNSRMYIDANIFPNVSRLYSCSYNYRDTLLHDTIIKGLDLGYIVNIKGTYISDGFGVRPFFNVKVDTIIGEHVKIVGSFTFYDVYFEELYLPNVEVIGSGQGNHSGTADIYGTSFSWMRKFVFLGDKLKAWQHMSQTASSSENAIYVITALTPPKFVDFADNSDNYTENANFVENNIWKYQRINFYVPDAVLQTYRTATNWGTMHSRWGNILPISSLSATYKQKISKWYTEPSND